MKKIYYICQGYSTKLDRLETIYLYGENNETMCILKRLFNPDDTIEVQDYFTGTKIYSFKWHYL
jgi:hypothetical protein